MEKSCKRCFYHCRIRGNDSSTKLGCWFYKFKVDATDVCDDFLLLEKTSIITVGSSKEGNSVLSRFSSMEKKEAEKNFG